MSTSVAGWVFPRVPCNYRPVKSAPKVQPELEAPIKALIEQEWSFGYRTETGLLGMNRTPCSGSSSYVARRCASGQLACGLASRPGRR